MKAAVIGIGSNSVRMLIADIAGGRMQRLSRAREGTRLFAGLDEGRNLSAGAMAASCAAVKQMAEAARAQQVQALHLFATSATRDAANQADFAAMLLRETGLTLEICSGETEAALSFLGATDGGESGVIDIGGGSTEIIVGCEMDVHCGFSCQMGAVRLAGQLPIRSREDVPAVCAAATDILEDMLQRHAPLPRPDSWRGTGGTFTTLAAIVRGVRWTDRTYMHGTVLQLDTIRRLALDMADLTVEQRRLLPGLQPNRADIIVHGICILIAVMDKLGIGEITVSEYGNLDGYMKWKYLHDGGSK